MRKLVLVSLLILVALNAFGHAGEVHKYMGTISALSEGGFTLAKTDGASIEVAVSSATVFQQANGSAATRAELTAGRRVVVTISTDGKTASLVRIAPAKKN
jgi:hypothetical protein